jgi:cellobiose phosphorylase
MAKRGKVAETQFGYFDVPEREYVITTHATPTFWLNYMGLEGELCAIVSGTSGGLTWYKDPLERRITRYFQLGSSKDRPGRWVFVRDNESGRFWSPSYQPVTREAPSRYECRHGIGYTRIRSLTRGIESELLSFIPLKETVEIQRLVLRNTNSKKARRLSVFTYREFINDTGEQDLANIQYSGHLANIDMDQADPRILYVTTSVFGDRPLPFLAVSEKPAGFDTKCETFLGDGSIEAPQVVVEGKTRGSLVGDDTAVGVFQIDVDLAPGEEKVIHIVLGVAKDKPEGAAKAKRWIGNDTAVLKALEDLKGYAVGLLETLQCGIPDPEAGVTINTWNPYQCWINFQFSRSISGYATGLRRSMGTRDSLQDLLGYMHMAPGAARERLLEIVSATQLLSGGCQHQYSALTKKGSGEIGFSDDHLWIVLAVSRYLCETADYSILDEKLGYSDGEDRIEDLYHHMLRAIRYSYDDRGAHGIPRMRSADWNDCIGFDKDNLVAESVLSGLMLVHMAKEMGPLTEKGGRGGVTIQLDGKAVPASAYFSRVAEDVTKSINGAAFLPEGYYARGVDWHGKWMGVPARPAGEGRMWLEPQPWSIMAGVADREMGTRAMDNVKKTLATPYGIQIVQPALELDQRGKPMVFPKGSKENAGIFCHPNPWAVIAETILGRGDRAYEYFRAFMPAAAHQEDPARYAAEPYVYGQLRYGREHREYGKAAGTWLTGTAAWNYVAATQYILGVRPDWEGLRIDPCIPSSWDKIRVTRSFRGSTYRIDIRNPGGVCKGVKSIRCDGRKAKGGVLPVFGDGAVHEVKVVMG